MIYIVRGRVLFYWFKFLFFFIGYDCYIFYDWILLIVLENVNGNLKISFGIREEYFKIY